MTGNQVLRLIELEHMYNDGGTNGREERELLYLLEMFMHDILNYTEDEIKEIEKPYSQKEIQ